MKRLMLAALVGAFALPGCIVAVEQRRTHYDPPPPPPPAPPAEVTVEWNDARTVVLREYYDCDWETVGAFEYYEDNYGIPEDDLFFCMYVSRASGRNFHEVIFTYTNCNRVLWDVCLHYRINHWDLFVNLPAGTSCPPAYHRAYGYYWRRDPRIVLTNYDCHALFWLRFGTFYYGWQPRDCFVRWDQCVDNRVRFVTVVHREYNYAGRGGYNWAHRPCVKVVERPERNRQVIVNKRVEVVKKVEVEVKHKSAQGQQVARPPNRREIDDRREDDRRKIEVERNREREDRKREPQRFEDYKKKDHDDKDDKKNPPPPKDDKKKEDNKGDKKQDDKKNEKKGDDRKDERKQPPPPPKRSPPPPPQDKEKHDEKKDDEKKDDKKRDDRKDDRDDRRDERKDDRKKEDKKDDGKKDDKKQDEKKQDEKKKDDR
ncbi:MAG TPA: hypothetical protein VFC86_05710, partial [Planctomycetota bacterium]|nr:hypothetical protein [Planctomycetota bacterium]